MLASRRIPIVIAAVGSLQPENDLASCVEQCILPPELRPKDAIRGSDIASALYTGKAKLN